MGNFTTHFTKDIGVINKHVKIYSTLVSKKIQIKTTMRHHYTPTRMAIINTNSTSVSTDMQKLEL